MATKKGSNARAKRRQEKKAKRSKQRQVDRRSAHPHNPSAEPNARLVSSAQRSAPGSASEIPLQDEYALTGEGPFEGLCLDPHGRPAVVMGRTLRILNEGERSQL
jgi:hypothetical protein